MVAGNALGKDIECKEGDVNRNEPIGTKWTLSETNCKKSQYHRPLRVTTLRRASSGI